MLPSVDLHDAPMPELDQYVESTPHNYEFENAFLGGIILRPLLIKKFCEVVKVDDFHREPNRWLYRAMLDAHEGGMLPNLEVVIDELKRHNRVYTLSDSNGPAALMRLLVHAPSSEEMQTYAIKIKDYATKRFLLELASRLASGAMNGRSSTEIIRDTEADLSLASQQVGLHLSQTKTVSEVAKSAMDRLDAAQEKSKKGLVTAIPTGLESLDGLLGGLHNSDLILVPGRPGEGKTALLATIAVNAGVTYRKGVVIFALEMSNEDVFNRMLAQIAGVDGRRIRDGKVRDDEWPSYYHAIEVLMDSRIYFDDTPALSIPQMRSKLQKLAPLGIDLILLDYVNLMMPEVKNQNRVDEVSYLSRNLKAIAREFDRPLVAAAAMNRAVEQRSDKSPVLSDLKESGSLEQDADVVAFVYREDKDPTQANITHVKVAKHRNGPTGVVNLCYQASLTKFTDVPGKIVTRKVDDFRNDTEDAE